jgi:AcrR family transcriptional regulator
MTTEKRDKILETALRLFVEHGFSGTSTSDIAKQAEVATGTLFHHFKTKEVLISELYLGAKTELADYLEGELPQKGLQAKFRALWFAFIDWAITHENQYRFFRHCEATPYISDSLRKEGEARIAFITELFSEAAERNKEDLSAYMLMDIFAGMVNGFINHLMKNPAAHKDQVLWEKAFGIFWKAIK